jgi:dTDP-4-dehydrorhamnose reductase
MKVLLIGATGMLGQDVAGELAARGHDVQSPGSSELNITDPESVAAITQWQGIDWCVNCAAYTAVDKAESEEQAAAELNALGPGYLARVCAMKGIKLAHVSTDFVFDGAATEPYKEDDRTNPLGVYGRTKLAGEEAVQAGFPMAVIFRTAWLYGPNGKSFPKTMIGAWEAGRDLKVVADQVGSPTYTPDLARTIVDAMERDIFPGVYHATGPDAMTWHELALQAITAHRDHAGIGRDVQIQPLKTEDWPTPATRPKYSVLSNAKLQAAGIAPMRSTSAALAEFVTKLG